MDVFGVYVSSTWLDLRQERDAVERAIHRMRDTKFVGMEYFGSRDESPARASVAEVDAANVYVGIFGGRYGSGISEQEYQRAIELGKQCLIYFKREDEIPSEGWDADVDARRRLSGLKAALAERHTISYFATPDDLAARITGDLHRLLFDEFKALADRSRSEEYSRALRHYFDDELDRSLGAYLRAVRSFTDSSYRCLPLPQGKSMWEVYVPLLAQSNDSAVAQGIQDVLRGAMAAPPGAALILGAPGAGKSTLLRHIAQHAWDHPEHVGLDDRHLPVIVRLQCLARVSGATIEERLWNALSEARDIMMDSPPPRGWFDGWTTRMSAPWLLLLDGFDEVPDDRRQEVMAWIRELLRRRIRIVLTSRETTELDRRAPFANSFSAFVLAALSDLQQETLAHRWLGTQADAFLDDLKRLQTLAVAGTPLLITIAVIVFQRDGRLPRRRSSLYRRFVEVWWQEALERGVREEIGPDFSDLAVQNLQYLACVMTTDPEKRSRTALEEALHAFLASTSGQLLYLTRSRTDRFLEVMGRRSGIFQCTTSGCEWLHLSFREYLAAEFLSSHRPDSDEALELCRHWYQRDRWQQVILFVLSIWNERGQDVTALLEKLIHEAESGETRAAAREPQPWMEQLPAMSVVFAARAIGEGVAVDEAFQERLLKDLFVNALQYGKQSRAERALSNVVFEHTAKVLAGFSQDPRVAPRLDELTQGLMQIVRGWKKSIGPAAIDDLVALRRFDEILDLATDSSVPVVARYRACEVLAKSKRSAMVAPLLLTMLPLPAFARLLRSGLKRIAEWGEPQQLISIAHSVEWPASTRALVPEALLLNGLAQEVYELAHDEQVAEDVRLPALILLAVRAGTLDAAFPELRSRLLSPGLDGRVIVLATEYLATAKAWARLRDLAGDPSVSPLNDLALDALKANERTDEIRSLFADLAAPNGIRFKAAALSHAPGQDDVAAATLLMLYREALHENPGDLEARRRRMHLYFELQRYEELITDCTAILTLNPDDTETLDLRGRGYLSTNSMWAAIVDFDAALTATADEGTRWSCLTHRAIAHTQLESHAKAVADFEAAANLAGASEYARQSPWYRPWYALSLHSIARHEDALSTINLALESDPNAANALAVRGSTYAALNRDEEEMADLNRAVELSPEYAWALGLRAECHRRAGRLLEAIDDFTRVLALNPTSVAAAAERLELYLRVGSDSEAIAGIAAFATTQSLTETERRCIDEALDRLQRAPIEAEPKRRDAARSLLSAWLLEQAGDAIDADAYHRAIANDPEWAAAHLFLAQFLSGQFESATNRQAEQEFLEAIRCAPDDAGFRQPLIRHLIDRVAWTSFFRQEHVVGIDACTHALALDADGAEALRLRFRLCWYEERHEEALDDVTRLLTLTPGDLELLSGRGQVLAEMGRYEEAVTELERVVALLEAGDNPIALAFARNGLGLAYAGVGLQEKALETLNASLAYCQENAWAYYNRAGVYSSLTRMVEAEADFRSSLQKIGPSLTRSRRERVERWLAEWAPDHSGL